MSLSTVHICTYRQFRLTRGLSCGDDDDATARTLEPTDHTTTSDVCGHCSGHSAGHSVSGQHSAPRLAITHRQSLKSDGQTQESPDL